MQHFPLAEILIGIVFLAAFAGLVVALRMPAASTYQQPAPGARRRTRLRSVPVGMAIVSLLVVGAITFEMVMATASGGFKSDINGDGMTNIVDIQQVATCRGKTPTDPGCPASLDVDTNGTIDDADTNLVAARWKQAPVSLVRSSPANGEGEVSVTRETVLEFSGPLKPELVDSTTFAATFGGKKLAANVHLSPDHKTVTLFYYDNLPANARVRVAIDENRLADETGYAVDADGNGVASGTATIDFDTLSLTVLPGTSVYGRVFASELDESGTGSRNVPLENVTIAVEGMEETIRTLTDRDGNFRLDPAPAGHFFVIINGRTAANTKPDGTYYPYVGKEWESIPGEATSVGDVYLPLVPAGTLQTVSATQDTTVKFPPSVLEKYPSFADVQITVPANALFDEQGRRGGKVGIAPVPPDRIPGALPPGLDFPVVITVQTDGGTNFDRPVPACFPNLSDKTTGKPLPAASKSALWSFNHDTGDWEVVGPMTVSADGKLACTDPGVGIPAPGWHGVQLGFVEDWRLHPIPYTKLPVLVNPCELPTYKDLLNENYPPDVLNSLAADGSRLQPMNEGFLPGQYRFDNYEVTVRLNNTSPEEILQEMALDLDGFLQDDGFSNLAYFNQRNPGHTPKHGDIYDLYLLDPHRLSIDGTKNKLHTGLVLSDLRSDRFVMTTITPAGHEVHPVNGSRAFGFERNKDGTVTFYTRGFYTAKDWEVSVGGEELQAKTWLSLLDGLTRKVEERGGTKVPWPIGRESTKVYVRRITARAIPPAGRMGSEGGPMGQRLTSRRKPTGTAAC